MRPSSLEPHRPKLTLVVGGPCQCAVCRDRRERFEFRVSVALVAIITAAGIAAWIGWGPL